MASSTTNYNLIKPDYEDNADIKDLNDNFDTIDTAMNNKVDKEIGKGLSTNDYTTAEKTKLDNLAEIKTVGTGLNLDDNGELTATGGGSGGTTNYNDLSNKPQINGNTLSGNKTSAQLGLASASDIPTTLADLSGDSTHRTVSDTEKAAWNNKSDFSGSYNDLTDKPTIPDELSDLTEDATHRTVTDTEKSTWNSKQNAIDSSHKLSADLVDDTSTTNKFATETELDQIATNKNNILYIEKANGKKNLVPNFGRIENGGCVYTYCSGGLVTVTGTKSGSLSFATLINNESLSAYGLSAGDQIVLVSDNANIGTVVIFEDSQGTQDAAIFVYNETKTVTIPSERTKWYLRLQVKPAATGTINETAKPMVCDKKLYDIDPTVTPYAMSNVELTAAIQAIQAQLANQ